MNINKYLRIFLMFQHLIYRIINKKYYSIVDLVGRVGISNGEKIYISSYYAFASYSAPQKGGGWFVWDSAALKSTHNGITKISPTVPWSGAQTTLTNYFQRVGETDTSGSGCWVRQYSQLDVMMAGAVGDGSANDTASINFALNFIFTRYMSLYFPAGTYLYDGSGELGAGNVIFGDGKSATTIKSSLASPTDGYLFRCQGTGSGVRSMGFDANVAQTGGCYVWLSNANVFIDDFYMTGDFNGVLMTGNVAEIRNGRMQNGASGAIRIRAEGGDNSQLIDNVTIGAQSPEISSAGIRVRNSSALRITNTNVIQQTIGLLIDPTTSTAGNNTTDTANGNVFSLYAENCFFDTCGTNGIRINPTGTASVVRCRFSNVWASSAGSDGIYINNQSSGTLSGMHFIDPHALINVGSGFSLGGTLSDIQILGGEICQNAYGVFVNSTVTKLSILGGIIGSGAGLNGNTNNGIVLSAGASSSDYITIIGNIMSGNGAAAIVDNSTGTNKTIYSNPGSTVTYLQKINSPLDISGSTGGQIIFPATQNASSNANTLDDYEEGIWTPALTFATPGDLSVAYSSASGFYTKIGRSVLIRFQVATSTFTHTTASGECRISGLPFTFSSGNTTVGGLSWEGITKAGYTNVLGSISINQSYLNLIASGSGVAASNVTAANMPSGGTIILRGSIFYDV